MHGGGVMGRRSCAWAGSRISRHPSEQRRSQAGGSLPCLRIRTCARARAAESRLSYPFIFFLAPHSSRFSPFRSFQPVPVPLNSALAAAAGRGGGCGWRPRPGRVHRGRGRGRIQGADAVHLRRGGRFHGQRWQRRYLAFMGNVHDRC